MPRPAAAAARRAVVVVVVAVRPPTLLLRRSTVGGAFTSTTPVVVVVVVVGRCIVTRQVERQPLSLDATRPTALLLAPPDTLPDAPPPPKAFRMSEFGDATRPTLIA